MAKKKDNNNNKVKCQYCGKEFSPRGIKAHEASCSERPRESKGMKVIHH